MAKSKDQAPYHRPYSPGMGCAGNEFPGEWPGGVYTPPPEPEGGAAENLVPESWDDEGAGERSRSIRSQIKRSPPGARW